MNFKKRFHLIAGPCVIESEEATLETAARLLEIAKTFDIDLTFKASFDKANRMALHSYRGPGIEAGLAILEKVKTTFGLAMTTDIHEPWQAAPVADIVDILQIPAYLCRQTDLLVAAAATGRPVNVKKGQFMAPDQMKHCLEKLRLSGASEVILTERGSTFGYNRLIVDMPAIQEMQRWGCKVCFDATHSVQQPGGEGSHSGGARGNVNVLTRAAIAAGADILFCEVHLDPSKAKSDAAVQLTPEMLSTYLPTWIALFDLVQNETNYVHTG